MERGSLPDMETETRPDTQPGNHAVFGDDDVYPTITHPRLDIPVLQNFGSSGSTRENGSSSSPQPEVSTAVRYRTARDDEDPAWLKACRTNYTTSRLYRLPEELLVDIADAADDSTQRLLRQSCRLFLRLVDDLDSRSHKQALEMNPPQDVSMRRLPLWLEIVQRDCKYFCDGCRQFQQSGEFKKALGRVGRWQLLYCRGCNAKHMRLLFSKAQRAAPDSERVCIGHEGRVRVCAHMDISLADLQKYVHLWPQIKLHTCRHCSHRDSRVFVNHDGERSAPGFVHNERNSRGFIGVPHISVMGSHPAVSVVLYVPAFYLDPEVPIKREHIRRFLAAQTANSFNGYQSVFCPHVRPDSEQLLLPFEPGRCACFPGDPNQMDGRHRHQGLPDGDRVSDDACCRCRVENKPAPPQHHFMDSVLFHFPLSTTMHFSKAHEYKCLRCNARYEWLRNSDGHVYLKSVRLVSHLPGPGAGATSDGWLMALDPETWGAWQDKEMHRITWCDVPGCETQDRWTAVLGKRRNIHRGSIYQI